jgi:hypothetical protein
MSDENKEAPFGGLNQAAGSNVPLAGTIAPQGEKKIEVPTKVDVSFYLTKATNWATHIKFGQTRVVIKGTDSIITIKTGDEFYDEKLSYLRGYKGNQKNGGTEFVELTCEDERPGGTVLLDSLLDLSKESLLNVLSDNDPKNRALSTGAIMMRILKEKGSL